MWVTHLFHRLNYHLIKMVVTFKIGAIISLHFSSVCGVFDGTSFGRPIVPIPPRVALCCAFTVLIWALHLGHVGKLPSAAWV